ncbi:tyrosine-type recombinase/integrase [Novosphingobium pokkalii]|uniref:Tyrosine-type recombinase/integrase n=1 Tax=Novosphingobium pokkalii TaxID=1770194 RepID=A0ABV7UZE6_9SPHN|nr:site-specific integrase [Novosphingobium pokkalii]GHC97359.1 integrase [Novosphingobium pokkalii]
MSLKALQINGFSASNSPYRKPDEKGLYLEVRPSGAKIWYFKYRLHGVEKRLSLGQWPDVGLKEARALRDKARDLIRDGGDPAVERRKKKIEARLHASNTFRAVAEDFISVRLERSGKAPATITKAHWFLSHLAHTVGHLPIADITPPDLLNVLRKVESEGKRETARRTRAFASRVFRHGAVLGLCKNDPAALLDDALAAPLVKHRAAILEPGKLGVLLRAIDEFTGTKVVKLAMQILPHVFLRPGELRFGKWDEIDWGGAVWRVPAERTKLRRPHSVPLSRQSLELLRSLHERTGQLPYMFPGQRKFTVPICENAINLAFRRMGFDQDTVTAHGWRATASTLLNESGLWHFDAIERALAHGHSNAVRGTYARGQHWDERVKMAQWWSDYLDGLKRSVE